MESVGWNFSVLIRDVIGMAEVKERSRVKLTWC